MDRVTRRRFLRTASSAALVAAALGPASCKKSTSNVPAPGSIVLYSSADDEVLRPIVKSFEDRSCATVRVVTDTEATKTTGLVERMLSERESPKADVWWSSEPLGTVRLARERALDELPADLFPLNWPAGLCGRGRAWIGFARRARVIAYSTKRVTKESVPSSLANLASSAWKGRLGMARPQFGTTRSQMAALAAHAGAEAFERWLAAMHANELRLYDGNSSVVRAIAQGEIDAGLTDTDDVWSARRNGWAVGASFERRDAESSAPGSVKPRELSAGALPSFGALLLPNTAALVRHAVPPTALARSLVAYLCSSEVERVLANSESRHIPAHSDVAREHADLAVADAWEPDFEAVADAVPTALNLCVRVLGA